ncbi:MAG TPA: hypothetical protein VD860_11695 [Azospirillum sp.]|nr:hypothetical protein [Azospirillum sp.]
MHRMRAVTASASLSFRRAVRVASALVVAGIAAGVALPADAAQPAQNKPAQAKPTQAKAPSKPAAGGPQACYNRSEHAAEQLIRMHTEMMIAGLTCKDVMPEKAPFAKYQEFTVKHRPTISKAEGELMSHFRRTGKGNATSKFDTYRTEVANEVSRRASIIGTDNYCKTFVPRVENAMSLSPDEVRTLTVDEKGAGLMHLSQQPLCDVKVVSGPDLPAGSVLASAEPPRAKTSKSSKPAKATKPAAPAKPKTAAAESSTQTASNEGKR